MSSFLLSAERFHDRMLGPHAVSARLALKQDRRLSAPASRCPEQPFDLGTFGKGETCKIKLTPLGLIEVGCAIHPEMKLTIEVSQSK